MSLPHWLAVSPHAVVLQSLHQLAWTDGVLIRDAIRVAYEDGDYSLDEKSCIQSWAQAWGIRPTELTDLEREHLEAQSSKDPFGP